MKATIVKIEGNNIEYVLEGGQEVEVAKLADWVKPNFVKLGDAELTVLDGMVTFCQMQVKQENTPFNKAPMSKKDNIVNIQGKDFMTYEGLLAKAHEKGEFSMVITESWVSSDMKMAWCKVRLTAGNQTFDGFGSSTPENTGTMTQSHPVEMSHTRAKGRSLRDYLNIGQAMAEELK